MTPHQPTGAQLRRLIKPVWSLSLLSLALAACGGGGGGGGGGITTPPAPPPPVAPPAPPPPPPPSIPSESAREYTRNWGVTDTKAYAAWKEGATGRGITVAVIDSGIEKDHPDLAANVSAASTDIIAGRNELASDDRHGTRVASVIAAPYNNFGTVGIAFNSTILSIRADVSDCTDPDDDVCFKGSDLARAITYAVNNGARIINLSLGGEGRLGTAFESAMANAISRGAIFAIASGNDEDANPGWPGRYATDPRFAGGIIVVGAHNPSGTMADFSNRAGVSAEYYLSAPGEGVIVDCKDTSCWSVGGTSFAAPAVSAAMALMKEAFPNLAASDIVKILLETATEAGDAGTDIVWGRGKLDIARAFQPVGSTSTPSVNGATPIGLDVPPGVYVGGPFGDALAATPALSTIAYDDYQRLFSINLGDAYRMAPRRSFQPDTPRPMMQSTVVAQGPVGTTLSLAAVLPSQEPEPVIARYGLYDAPWMGSEQRREALFEVRGDTLSFSAWQGLGGARSPFRSGSGDGFAALAQSDQAVRGALHFNGGELGQFVVSADTGTGDRRLPLQPVEQDAATYARMGVDWRMGAGGLSFSLGGLDEKLGPLGSFMPSGSDLALPSTTRFSAVGGDVQLNKTLTLMGEVGLGRTEIDGRFLHLSKAALSSNWRLGLQAACRTWWAGCSSLTWEVSQPLRIERGTFEATLADVPLDYFDPVTFSRRQFSARPSGRQIDMTVRSLHTLRDGSRFQIEATAIRDEQHRRGAKPGYAFMAQWRRGF